MALQLRRGTDAERLTITPAVGEIIYTTDTKKIYVGDGTTVGGNVITANTLNDLTDVTITSAAEGNTLYYDATTSQWKNNYVLAISDNSNWIRTERAFTKASESPGFLRSGLIIEKRITDATANDDDEGGPAIMFTRSYGAHTNSTDGANGRVGFATIGADYRGTTNLHSVQIALAPIGSNLETAPAAGQVVYDGRTDATGISSYSANTNTLQTVLTLNANTSATPAVGYGPRLNFTADTGGGNQEFGAYIAARLVDVTPGSEDFVLDLGVQANGAAFEQRVSVTGAGDLLVDNDVNYSGDIVANDADTSIYYNGTGSHTFNIDNTTTISGATKTINIGYGGASGSNTVINLGTDLAGANSTVNVLKDLVVSGDLTVNGTTTTINTATLNVEDNIITLNYGAAAPGANAGIEVARGVGNFTPVIRWNESTDKWEQQRDGTNYIVIPISTAELTEDTNLYYTDARARNSISVTDTGGDGSLAYNSSTGVITYTGPSASEVRAHFSAGTGVTITSGQISIGQDVATTAEPTFAGASIGNVRVAYSTSNNTITTSSGDLTISSADDEVIIQDDIIVTGDAYIRGELRINSDGTDVDAVLYGNRNAVTSTLKWNGTTWTFADPVDVTGTVGIDSRAYLDTGTLTTSATTADQTVDSWSASTYRTVKYIVSMTSGTEYQAVEILVTHNGTTAYQTTYADVATGSSLATFNVTISGGNVLLRTTPTNAVTTYKFTKTAIVV